MKHEKWEIEGFLVSTDPALLDLDRTHGFIAHSYWAAGIPKSILQKSIKNSLCFGLYRIASGSLEQVGFARIVSDYSTFAYLGDVYISENWRKKGLSKWLMECVLAHPELQGLRRFCLGTKDAHQLYSRFGFEVIQQPQNWMEIKVSDIYRQNSESHPS